MKLDIKAEDIMNRNFPIFDSSVELEKCIKKINKHEACIVLDKGFLHSVVCYDDILKSILAKSKKIEIKNVKPSQNFAVVKPETDLFEVIKIMAKRKVNFVIVKDENYLGLITKREIAEINQVLFDLMHFRDTKKMNIETA